MDEKEPIIITATEIRNRWDEYFKDKDAELKKARTDCLERAIDVIYDKLMKDRQ